MAWENKKVKDCIIDILNKHNMDYELDEGLSIVSIQKCTSIGNINFSFIIAKKYIAFATFTFDPVAAEHITNVLRLINEVNSHLDCGIPYMYLTDDMCVGMKGEMYCGENPDIDTDFIESLNKRIEKIMVNMMYFSRSYCHIQAGYDAITAFCMSHIS